MRDDPLPLSNFMSDRYSVGAYGDLYSGASGIVMRASHRMMERDVPPEQNASVLEIGGGARPHFEWMNAAQMASYTISDRMRLYREKIDTLRTRLPGNIKLELHDFEADPGLETLPGGYTRIIASHVLEHIADPEHAIRAWDRMLAPDGLLSIAIPCDPGWGWRLGQLAAFRGYKLGLTFAEYDLIMSREHITSVQRVLKLVRYYFHKPRVRWYPAVVPVVDFNLVCTIDVRASDRRLKYRAGV